MNNQERITSDYGVINKGRPHVGGGEFDLFSRVFIGQGGGGQNFADVLYGWLLSVRTRPSSMEEALISAHKIGLNFGYQFRCSHVSMKTTFCF